MGKNTQPFNTELRAAIQKELGTLCQSDDLVIEAGKQRDDATGRLAKILLDAKVKPHWLESPYSHRPTGKLHDGVVTDHVRVFNYLMDQCDQIQFAGDAGKQRQALMATHDANPGNWKELVTPEEAEIIRNARGYANSKVGKIRKRMLVELDREAAKKKGIPDGVKKGNLEKACEAIEKAYGLLENKPKLLATYYESNQRSVDLKTLMELQTDLAEWVDIEQRIAIEDAHAKAAKKAK